MTASLLAEERVGDLAAQIGDQRVSDRFDILRGSSFIASQEKDRQESDGDQYARQDEKRQYFNEFHKNLP